MTFTQVSPTKLLPLGQKIPTDPPGEAPQWTPTKVAMIQNITIDKDKFAAIGRKNTEIITGKCAKDAKLGNTTGDTSTGK